MYGRGGSGACSHRRVHPCGAVQRLDAGGGVLKALQAVAAAEEACARELPGSQVPSWGVQAQLRRLLDAWVSQQLNALKEWLLRLLASETWQAISAGSPSCARRARAPCLLPLLTPARGPSRGVLRRSAPEAVKIGEEAMASLVLNGSLPPAAAGAMLDGLKGLLLQYAGAVVSQLSSSELVPPVPALVRYKREVVAKAETATATSRSAQLQRFARSVHLPARRPHALAPLAGACYSVAACDPKPPAGCGTKTKTNLLRPSLRLSGAARR